MKESRVKILSTKKTLSIGRLPKHWPNWMFIYRFVQINHQQSLKRLWRSGSYRGGRVGIFYRSPGLNAAQKSEINHILVFFLPLDLKCVKFVQILRRDWKFRSDNVRRSYIIHGLYLKLHRSNSNQCTIQCQPILNFS